MAAETSDGMTQDNMHFFINLLYWKMNTIQEQYASSNHEYGCQII